ncbi:MAG: hypothetical protein U1F42_05535 [Candidatus Competibacteraceae bacterium]
MSGTNGLLKFWLVYALIWHAAWFDTTIVLGSYHIRLVSTGEAAHFKPFTLHSSQDIEEHVKP